MNISKPVAAMIGVLTLWPIVYVFLFFAFIVSTMLSTLPNGAPNNNFALFPIIIVLHLATMLLSMILLVFYIVHVFKNPALAGDNRVLWAVVLFMGNALAMPVYWYLYIWRTPLPKLGDGTNPVAP